MPIFDNWEDVFIECDSCERYYNSQCDGVDIGKERKCTQYVATRRSKFADDFVKLKDEFDEQKQRMKDFKKQVIVINICIIAFLVTMFIQMVT